MKIKDIIIEDKDSKPLTINDLNTALSAAKVPQEKKNQAQQFVVHLITNNMTLEKAIATAISTYTSSNLSKSDQELLQSFRNTKLNGNGHTDQTAIQRDQSQKDTSNQPTYLRNRTGSDGRNLVHDRYYQSQPSMFKDTPGRVRSAVRSVTQPFFSRGATVASTFANHPGTRTLKQNRRSRSIRRSSNY